MSETKKIKCDCGSCDICSLPAKDSYEYRGWLMSDSLIKRSFAVAGHFYLAYFLILIPLLVIAFFSMFFVFGVRTAIHNNYDGKYERDWQGDDMKNMDMMNQTTGKINIEYVCEDAAPSMAADQDYMKFVKDCVAGLYPNVIDTYKENNKVQ
ncbi:MAG: hypothetical protein QG614_351 [Patescibacteria group bacterium]|nr:hypothetical protein [Patescibacteria group bacterium]